MRSSSSGGDSGTSSWHLPLLQSSGSRGSETPSGSPLASQQNRGRCCLGKAEESSLFTVREIKRKEPFRTKDCLEPLPIVERVKGEAGPALEGRPV
ncbi:hypothetical protein STEG23_008330 [Scotinomys teguina]